MRYSSFHVEVIDIGSILVIADTDRTVASTSDESYDTVKDNVEDTSGHLVEQLDCDSAFYKRTFSTCKIYILKIDSLICFSFLQVRNI